MGQPARLTSGLLARKGQALPAGGFAATGIDLKQPLPSRVRPRPCSPDHLHALERPAATRPDTPEPNPMRPRQQERVALTVRLDTTRHAKLKILAARQHRSARDVIVEALDAYVDACGAECACMKSGGACTGHT